MSKELEIITQLERRLSSLEQWVEAQKSPPPWYPPVPEGFGPWIEREPYARYSPDLGDKILAVLSRQERRERYKYAPSMRCLCSDVDAAGSWDWPDGIKTKAKDQNFSKTQHPESKNERLTSTN